MDTQKTPSRRQESPHVFHAEPLRSDHPLATMDNVTLTAHAGFRTLEASMTLLRRAIDIVSGIVLVG
jgi:D-3-phosphoglycerate dehydrogenase